MSFFVESHSHLKGMFKYRKLTFFLFVLITLFFLYDIIGEIFTTGLVSHVIFEIIILSITVWLLFVEIKDSISNQKRLTKEQEKVGKLSGELSQFISEEMIIWKLTKSETDVAWMMLKGLSFPEIARYRKVKEKTVRQQAVAIYAKSGTKNRMGFIAYFFEELLGKSVNFSQQIKK